LRVFRSKHPSNFRHRWGRADGVSALTAHIEDCRRRLLLDPQTSGGLLVACEASAALAILDRIREGDGRAAVIGQVESGDPVVVIE
jgi:selenide, water dikinase